MLLLAQEGGGGFDVSLIFFFVLMGAVFYFLLIRPQRQRQKRQQELTELLEVGDQVETIGGLFGVIVSLDEDAVVLGIEDGRMRVSRRAIARRLTDDDQDE